MQSTYLPVEITVIWQKKGGSSVNQITEFSQRERAERRSSALIQFGRHVLSVGSIAERDDHMSMELSNVQSCSFTLNPPVTVARIHLH